MMGLLAKQIEAGDRHHREIAQASSGAWKVSQARIAVRGLSGSELAEWFRGQAARGRLQDKLLLLNAHPRHYVDPPEPRSQPSLTAWDSGVVAAIHLTNARPEAEADRRRDYYARRFGCQHPHSASWDCKSEVNSSG